MQQDIKPVHEDETILARLQLPDSGMPAAPAPAKRGQRRPFTQMTTDATIAGAKALKCPAFIVWHYIHYRVWADSNRTVPLPTRTLKTLGVSKEVKRRALQRLEQAGLIKVVRRDRKSPLVTLL